MSPHRSGGRPPEPRRTESVNAFRIDRTGEAPRCAVGRGPGRDAGPNHTTRISGGADPTPSGPRRRSVVPHAGFRGLVCVGLDIHANRVQTDVPRRCLSGSVVRVVLRAPPRDSPDCRPPSRLEQWGWLQLSHGACPMNLARSPSAVQHRQSLLFGLRACFARKGSRHPPPRSPNERALELCVVALIVFLPPVGVFVWWRRYRRKGRRH